MTARRPGAPRRAGRPVSSSAGRPPKAAPARGTAGSARARVSSSRPADAARPRRSASAAPSPTDGPVWGITRRALVLIALIVVALATLVPTVNRYVVQRQQLATAQEQVAQRQSEVTDLQAAVTRWDDPAFVAAQARERLLFAMPGETQYRLTDTSGQDVPLTEGQQTAKAAQKQDWFDTMWTSVEGASRLRPEDIPDAAPTSGSQPSETSEPTP